jgi:hypothetical protein
MDFELPSEDDPRRGHPGRLPITPTRRVTT